MVLDPSILARIQDEIGEDADFTSGDLEDIYVDVDRGNYSTLNTALIVWKRRLFNLQNRSFDLTTEGTLLARNQRIRFIERRVKELEMLTDKTLKGENMVVLSPTQILGSGDPEFS